MPIGLLGVPADFTKVDRTEQNVEKHPEGVIVNSK
jgi:hypothetical protein